MVEEVIKEQIKFKFVIIEFKFEIEIIEIEYF